MRMNLLSIIFGLFFLIIAHDQVTTFLLDDLEKARTAMLQFKNKKAPVAPTRPKYFGWYLPSLKAKPRVTTINHNKKNEAIYKVEEAMTDARLLRRPPQQTTMINYIKMALDNDNVMFARKALGIGFYAASKSAGRKKRSTRGANPVKTFLDNVTKKTGYEKVKKLLATDGEATLMFAMDITGSMRGEIQAAKAIVSAISDYARNHPVDFILSSFGDPLDQGDVVYKKQGKVDEFKKEVGKLKAYGGGDCAEYAFNGMLGAFNGEKDPSEGSPMYLFTDATPKDANPDNKDALLYLVDEYKTTINVLAWKDCFQGPYSFNDFKQLAESTGGQFFELKTKELKSISETIINALGGPTTIACGNHVASTRSISIPVDETISNLVITITTTKTLHANNVKLFTPTGRLWTTGKTTLSKVVIYDLKYLRSSRFGIWKLKILASAGEFTYSAKALSEENANFLYSFTKKIRGKIVSVKQPLTGEKANLSLVVSRTKKLNKNSLKLEITDVNGRSLQTINKLQKLGKSRARFSVSFKPPSKKFKIKLKGKTKTGRSFERVSQFVNEAKPLLLKVFYTSKYFTIPKRGTTTMMLYLYNTSIKRQCVKITVKDTLKYKYTIFPRKRSCVLAKSRKIVRISVKATKADKTGKAENVIVTATTVNKPKIIISEVVPFMVI